MKFAKLFDIDDTQVLVTIQPRMEEYLGEVEQMEVLLSTEVNDMRVGVSALWSMKDRDEANTYFENFGKLEAESFLSNVRSHYDDGKLLLD
jgi:hypothetical protein